jgi:hypothetical protein
MTARTWRELAEVRKQLSVRFRQDGTPYPIQEGLFK